MSRRHVVARDPNMDSNADKDTNGSPSSDEVITRALVLPGVDLHALFGQHDFNLRLIESLFAARISARGDKITIEGSPLEVERIEKVFLDLAQRIKNGEALTEQYVRYTAGLIRESGAGAAHQINSPDTASFGANGIRPRTVGQREYLEAIAGNDIVFAIGPAGTGKTFLAVAAAVANLRSGRVRRIVLVRPAVEAGESLGFLPGDIRAKVDPYLRPIYDALHDMMPGDRVRRLMENGVIEIAPLAFMRGRTLGNAFVVLDEAQNSTGAQMKMFLTRLGENSKAVVTGDITQIDLIKPESSGLLDAERTLQTIDGLKFIYLTEKDVVRHRLVQDIIRAYERTDGRQK